MTFSLSASIGVICGLYAFARLFSFSPLIAEGANWRDQRSWKFYPQISQIYADYLNSKNDLFFICVHLRNLRIIRIRTALQFYPLIAGEQIGAFKDHESFIRRFRRFTQIISIQKSGFFFICVHLRNLRIIRIRTALQFSPLIAGGANWRH